MSNIINSEYQRLTESLKTFMSDCKGDTKGEVLCKMLSYPYKNQRKANVAVSPKNASNLKSPTKTGKPHNNRQPFKVKVHPPTPPRPDLLETHFPLEPETTKPENLNLSQLSILSEDDSSFKTAGSIIFSPPTPKQLNATLTDAETSFKSARGVSFFLDPTLSEGRPKFAPKSVEKYRRRFKSKVDYFESKSGCSLTGRVKPAMGRTSTMKQVVSKRRAPMIREAVLKQTVVEQLKHAKSVAKFEVLDLLPSVANEKVVDVEPTPEKIEEYQKQSVRNFRGKVDFFEEFFQSDLCSNIKPSTKKDRNVDKFVVNLYEPKALRSWRKVQSAIAGGLIKVNSELHIKDSQDSPKIEDLPKSDLPEALDVEPENPCIPVAFAEIEDVAKVSMVFEDVAPINVCQTQMDDTYSVTSSHIESLLDRSMEEYASNAQLDVSLVSSLMQAVHTQSQILNEATKAVKECNKANKLANSKEQLEAERILLIAGLKRELLLQEIRTTQYQPTTETSDSNCGARLTISNLEFPLVSCEDSKGSKQYFVATCSVGSVLQASQMVERKDQFLNFGNEFVFENLALDAIVNLRVYQVKIKARQEQRRSLLKFSCLKTVNRRRNSRKLQYKDSYSGLVKESQVLPSIFSLCGSLQTNVESLLKAQKFMLDDYVGTAIYGVAQLTAEVTNISITTNHCGFLTLGLKNDDSIDWDRKWCRLHGTALRFWNHPNEEGVQAPRMVLNLKRCMGEEIKDADKSECRRSRALLIEIDEHNETIVSKTYFLAADSTEDMKTWKKSLNGVLRSLGHWKTLGHDL